MRTMLASASATVLALSLGAQAEAQVEPTLPGQDPLTAGEPATAPGLAVDPLAEDDRTAPGVADDVLADDPTAPGVGGDPLADDPTAQGVATDPLADDPTVDPTAPGLSVDPLADAPPSPDVAAAEDASPRLGLQAFHELLGEIGIEDRGLFFGTVIQGETEGGHRVAVLVGAEDFEAGEGDAPIEFLDIGAELREAGFANVRQDARWVVMQGTLDGHTVFAMEAPAEVRATGEALAEPAEPGEFDTATLAGLLGEAGIEAVEIDARLFRATRDEHTIFLLIGPRGMASGEAVELSADDVRGMLEEADLTDVAQVEDDIHVLRGEHDGGAILAIAGGPLDQRAARN